MRTTYVDSSVHYLYFPDVWRPFQSYSSEFLHNYFPLFVQANLFTEHNRISSIGLCFHSSTENYIELDCQIVVNSLVTCFVFLCDIIKQNETTDHLNYVVITKAVKQR